MSRPLAQQVTLAIIPKITASLSLLGSLWIVVEISSHFDKGHNVYHRLLFAMSIYDILESVWNIASTWPIPRGTEGIYGASGTVQTCVAQGFFLQFGLGVPIYNASLSIYYLLVIRYSWTERRVARRVEPAFHAVAFVYSFGTAVAAIALDLFNNANLWCWIAPLPQDCLDSRRHGSDNDNPCVRGDNAWLYRWAFYFAPLWFCISIAIVSILMVYHAVLKRESATRRYQYPSSSLFFGRRRASLENGGDSPAPCEPTRIAVLWDRLCAPCRKEPQQRLRRRNSASNHPKSRQVLGQAVWYSGAFFMTHIFSTVNRVLQQVQGHTYFTLIVFHSFFDPFQGFLNFLVYRRPRYLKYRKRHPTESRWKAIKSTLRFTFLDRPRQTTTSMSQLPVSIEDSEQEPSFRVAAHRSIVGGMQEPSLGLPSARGLQLDGAQNSDDELEMVGFGRQQSRRSGMLLLLDESTKPEEGEEDDEEENGLYASLNKSMVHFADEALLEQTMKEDEEQQRQTMDSLDEEQGDQEQPLEPHVPSNCDEEQKDEEKQPHLEPNDSDHMEPWEDDDEQQEAGTIGSQNKEQSEEEHQPRTDTTRSDVQQTDDEDHPVEHNNSSNEEPRRQKVEPQSFIDMEQVDEELQRVKTNDISDDEQVEEEHHQQLEPQHNAIDKKHINEEQPSQQVEPNDTCEEEQIDEEQQEIKPNNASGSTGEPTSEELGPEADQETETPTPI